MAKKTQPPKPSNDSVAKIVADYDASWNYRSSSWHTKWQNMNKLYNSERVYVGYNGISDTFVPMAYSLVETMVSATSGDKPMIEYMPTKIEQETNTEVLNALFSYYWDLDQWTPKLIQHNRGLFKSGTSVLHTYWNIDHPVLEIIPLRDFFCDPSATFFNRENARYMGHRFLASKKELEKERVIDPETGEFVAKYKNLDKLSNFDSGDQTDKEEKDTDMGSTTEDKQDDDQVEVICHETLDKITYIGNRQEVIYEHTNYFKERQQFLGIQNPTGMFSYIVDSFAPDESQLYGKSVIEPIAKHQELLNDLTNQNIDAVSWSIDPEMELDPQYSSYLDKMKSATGNVYPFKPGSYQAVQKPLLPTNVFNERTNIKNEIREATAIDEIIKGVGAGAGETTATEIKAQVSSSGRRFGLIVSMLENGGYYQLAKLVFQMVQMYVTNPVMFRVVGQKGIDWQQFDPEMFKGDYEPRIKLKATLEYEKKYKMRDLKELYTAMLGSSYVNQEVLTRMIIQKGFDMDANEVQQLVKSEEQLAEEAQGKEGQKKDETDPKELINYKDAPPDVQAQMEAKAGYEPSEVHGGRLSQLGAKDFADEATAIQTALPQPNSPSGVAPSAMQQGPPPNGQE